jgi:hypothetical protein
VSAILDRELEDEAFGGGPATTVAP